MRNIKPYFHIYQGCNYLRIPKTGSTSISEKTSGVRVYKPNYNRFTFTVLRHPAYRVFSAYHECIRRRTFAGKFEDYLLKIQKSGFWDEHQLPLRWYIDNTPIKIDHIYSNISEFERDNKVILSYLNTTEFKNYTEMEDSMGLIKAIYSPDFALYDKILKNNMDHKIKLPH